MNRRMALRALGLSIPLFQQAGAVCSDEPDDEKARADAFHAIAEREIRNYTMRLDTFDGPRLERREEPVLRWSNPLVGSIHGNVYIWTTHGRPQVVASLYKWYHPFQHRTNEFQSLSTQKVIGERDGQTVWTASRPGITFRPVPKAPEPAATPAQRLRQMRAIAKDFTASSTERPTAEKPQPLDRDLRLLTQPIYRYEGVGGNLVDGALFVFVLGTDPEAILSVEYRKTQGMDAWHYALARMNSIAIHVSYQERPIWEAPMMPRPDVDSHREPYTTFMFRKEEEAATP